MVRQKDGVQELIYEESVMMEGYTQMNKVHGMWRVVMSEIPTLVLTSRRHRRSTASSNSLLIQNWVLMCESCCPSNSVAFHSLRNGYCAINKV